MLCRANQILKPFHFLPRLRLNLHLLQRLHLLILDHFQLVHLENLKLDFFLKSGHLILQLGSFLRVQLNLLLLHLDLGLRAPLLVLHIGLQEGQAGIQQSSGHFLSWDFRCEMLWQLLQFSD